MSHIELTDKAVDQLAGTLLVVPVFSDERPPMGPASLIDWRLNGQLSQLMVDGQFSGKAMERLLVAAGSKLPNEWVLFFGAGDSGSFDEEGCSEKLLEAMASSSLAAGYTAMALALPKRLSNRLSMVVEAVEGAMQRHAISSIQCEIAFYPA